VPQPLPNDNRDWSGGCPEQDDGGAAGGGEPDPCRLSRDQLQRYLRARTTVSVPFAGRCCGISRSASYAAARDGSLKTLKLGHRLLVPTTWLEGELGLGAASGDACICAPRGAG
jgi:hypothetical protein